MRQGKQFYMIQTEQDFKLLYKILRLLTTEDISEDVKLKPFKQQMCH